jgi:hypothetical protein
MAEQDGGTASESSASARRGALVGFAAVFIGDGCRSSSTCQKITRGGNAGLGEHPRFKACRVCHQLGILRGLPRFMYGACFLQFDSDTDCFRVYLLASPHRMRTGQLIQTV